MKLSCDYGWYWGEEWKVLTLDLFEYSKGFHFSIIYIGVMRWRLWLYIDLMGDDFEVYK